MPATIETGIRLDGVYNRGPSRRLRIAMDYLFLLIAILSLCWGLWLVRINRWPRVQVAVLRTWEEVTGHEGRYDTGWRHAELAYWFQGQKHTVLWREELSLRGYMPAACSMVLDPAQADQPQFPASWKLPSILFLVAALLSLSALSHLLK